MSASKRIRAATVAIGPAALAHGDGDLHGRRIGRTPAIGAEYRPTLAHQVDGVPQRAVGHLGRTDDVAGPLGFGRPIGQLPRVRDKIVDHESGVPERPTRNDEWRPPWQR
jgi:hypothetical protein